MELIVFIVWTLVFLGMLIGFEIINRRLGQLIRKTKNQK